MQKQITEALEVEKFQAWLDSKEPEAIVGSPTEKESCPLACYLKETGAVGDGKIWVTADWVQRVFTYPDYEDFPVGEPLVLLPEWAKDFVELVDQAPEGHQITAIEAKNVLEEVTSEAEPLKYDPEDIPF